MMRSRKLCGSWAKEEAMLSLQKSINKKVLSLKQDQALVGVAGFEPTTSSTPCWRDTRLRYTPKILWQIKVAGLKIQYLPVLKFCVFPGSKSCITAAH